MHTINIREKNYETMECVNEILALLVHEQVMCRYIFSRRHDAKRSNSPTFLSKGLETYIE